MSRARGAVRWSNPKASKTLLVVQDCMHAEACWAVQADKGQELAQSLPGTGQIGALPSQTAILLPTHDRAQPVCVGRGGPIVPVRYSHSISLLTMC